MELFHEYKNRYFNLVFKLLNLSKDGLTQEEILKIIDEEAYDEKLIGKDFITFEGLILNQYSSEENLNILKKINEKYYPVLNENKEIPLAVRFSNLEKQWLKGMLQEKMTREFLGEDLVLKLEKELADVQAVKNETIERTNRFVNEEEDFKNIKELFFKVVQGIINDCPIRYTNKDKHGNEYKDKLAIPLRLEYSLRDESFRLSVYSIDEDRPIMILLKNLKSIELEPSIKTNKNRQELLIQLKDKKYSKEPIVLELTDERMAMERCFMGLSSYERSTRSLGDNRYEVKIHYYTFDEDEVIRKIISLGPYVVVKSPESVRSKIIDILKKC
ncbi:WYL domain-containing protein [Clostridium sp. SHJSY1]|uniref:WYL domain-containing protein n=1 Tax=Clostridium sp. SHJSY1 TaxID=2942483 RepID=UPI0028758CCC|nr:WYL domain-containing protein [Clostridium sp. SHJSY1]MDS0525264.1 WYL domain-containing protein [Clostridium sp. SHJSY1]